MFGVVTLTFVLIHAAPGEPFAYVTDDARFSSAAEREAFLRRYGLDRPLPVQYVAYLGRLTRGDLGESLSLKRPVGTLISERLPRTLLLMGTAIVVGFALGVAAGAWQAGGAGSRGDRILSTTTVALGSLPDFWIAIALLLLFALKWRWFPVSGMVDSTVHDYLSPLGKLGDTARHLVLPALSLTLLVFAVVARHQRAAVLDTMPNDYIRTARAKGLPHSLVVYRHALRNALLPTLTLFGLTLPALVGGAVFVESIFAWPGLGMLAISSIATRDYQVVLGVSLMTSVLVVAAGIATDLAYAVADPRTRRA